MNPISWTAVLAVSLVTAAGCRTYNVAFNGYGSSDRRPCDRSATFAFVPNSDAANPLLEQEVGEKLALLLASHGYNRGNVENAQCGLLVAYGIGEPNSRAVGLPVYTQGQTTTATAHGPGGNTVVAVTTPGTTTYMQVTVTKYSRWLNVTAVDLEALRTTRKLSVVWVGGVASSGRNSDLREVMNYLIIAVGDRFGWVTQKALHLSLSSSDERAVALMEGKTPPPAK